MKGERLILETRVNKKDRDQHLRQGVKNGNKESTLETRAKKDDKLSTLEARSQHKRRGVNIGDKRSTLTTAAQK